jgi:hypothetical protein
VLAVAHALVAGALVQPHGRVAGRHAQAQLTVARGGRGPLERRQERRADAVAAGVGLDRDCDLRYGRSGVVDQ